jgi:micrococcal nuclease
MRYLRTAVFVLFILNSFSYALTYDQVGTRKRALKDYGSAEISSVGMVEEIYSFRCDIKGWPPIIGKDVPVRIAGLQLPDIVVQQGGTNEFFQQEVIRFTEAFLKGTQKIELINIRRGKDFCLVANAIVDSNSLADILIEKGFAKKEDKTQVAAKPQIQKITTIKTQASHENQTPVPEDITWVASSNSKIFHSSACSFAKRMKKDTTIQFPTRNKAVETGRRPCKSCKP